MKITCVSALRQLLLDLNCSSALDQFRKDGGTGQCLSDVMLWLLPCPIYHLLADRCSWLLFSDTNMYIITPPLSKHLKLVIKTLCVLEVIWFLSTCNLWCNLPSLYTGSFVSEFWFLEKTILLLLSYCVDRSLFGGGGWSKKRNSVQLSRRAICACLWHSTFPAQVTTQKDHEPQSKQVRHPSSCPDARNQAVTTNIKPTFMTL